MLSQKVKKLRERKGVPAYVAAYEAGVSLTIWALMETHGLPPKRQKTRERIARYLGVSVDDLFGSPEPAQEEVGV